MSEVETRGVIDAQLRQTGWEADTQKLRFSLGVRPEKGRNLAIAEWPTMAGPVDYALFVGLKLVATIEAKAAEKDVFSVLDAQCKDYSSHIRPEDFKYQVGVWGKFQVPFTFASNGRAYIEQIETKSGIWFLDLRKSDNAPKALRGWLSPKGIISLLEENSSVGDKNLQNMSCDLLQDKGGLGLRYYQVNAIRATENAILDGQRRVLIAMATGTGKTRTVLGMIYRFLRSGRFRRILFLVDRTALGKQTDDVFKSVKLEDLLTLTQIYMVRTFGAQDNDAQVQIATVQSMVKLLLYNEDGTKPGVTDFDLIIVDEAHRGYLLDKEMTDDELVFRDQKDFQSKYRSVIEYFDAVKIALTATPALHTTQIFGRPVFQYTYREAVLDGFLVDHDAPHRLKTKLAVNGIHYQRGDDISVYDSATCQTVDTALWLDELDFDIDDFNRSVVTESFNRAVLEEIANDIDPANPERGKTLIFAVNDSHADLIVEILKKIYTARGIDNDAVMKITGNTADGNRTRILDTIKRFKNERLPNIAVTVDLLTTGIDVPEITKLVFMRRVKSRILFEQMMGRATRLCPEINKTHFEIYDPVGVYESLEPVNTMKPVAANPTSSFADLLDGLKVTTDENALQAQINQVIAKLQRKKRTLDKKSLEDFATLTGGLNPEQFISELRKSETLDSKKFILDSVKAFAFLDQTKGLGARPIVISHEPDELLEHTRSFGNGQSPEDYLVEFTAYIKNHLNDIAALNIVCTKPSDLRHSDLKTLHLELAEKGFTVPLLNSAVSKMTNQEITADIISLIRRYAIGSPLLSHDVKIQRAIEKLKQGHDFSPAQLKWLDRIATYLRHDEIFNTTVFDEDSRFQAEGGFKRFNAIFNNRLEEIVTEFNRYLYEDEGESA